MRKQAVFFILSAVLFCVPSYADFVMKITADDAELAVGEATWMHVWGWLTNTAPGNENGLASWQVDAVTSGDGSVQVTTGFEQPGVEDIKFFAPDPLETSPGVPAWTSFNTPQGHILDLNAILDFDELTSTAGIGTGDGNYDNPLNYTLLASFHVEALTVGTVSYSLNNIVADLADFTVVTAKSFYAGGSDVLTIVPEPTSLVLLSGFGILGLLRRRKV